MNNVMLMVIKCDLFVEVIMGVIGFNECLMKKCKGFLKMLCSSRNCQNDTEGRSTSSLDRASSWVGRANKQNMSSSCL